MAGRGLFGGSDTADHWLLAGFHRASQPDTAAVLWIIDDQKLITAVDLDPREGQPSRLHAVWGRDWNRFWTVGNAGLMWSCDRSGSYVSSKRVTTSTAADLLAITGSVAFEAVYVAGTAGTLLELGTSSLGAARRCPGLPTSLALRGVTVREVGRELTVLAVGEDRGASGALESALVTSASGGTCSVANAAMLGLTQPATLRDIWVAPRGEAFVVGDGGTVLRWAPGSATVEPLADGRKPDLLGVWGTARAAFAVGAGGALYRRELP